MDQKSQGSLSFEDFWANLSCDPVQSKWNQLKFNEVTIIPYDFAKKVRARGKTQEMEQKWRQAIEKSITFMNKAFEQYETGVKVGSLDLVFRETICS